MSKDFGAILREVRKSKKIKIKNLSEKTGITSAQIRNLEIGKCKPQAITIAKLSEALEYDFE